MARSFVGNGNYLSLANPGDPGSVGAICLRVKTNWSQPQSPGDLVFRTFWQYTGPNGTLHFMYDPGNVFGDVIRCGWIVGGTDYRKTVVPNEVSFGGLYGTIMREGWWQDWMIAWDAPAGKLWAWYDGTLVFGKGVAPEIAAPVPHPIATGMTSLTIGALPSGTGFLDADAAEFARFDYIPNIDQRLSMQLGGIAGISPPPVHWVKILGDASPEPAMIGPSMVVVGSPAKADHPRLPCDGELTDYPPIVKPAASARPNMDLSICDHLLYAWHFAEGTGLPKERVDDVPATDSIEQAAGGIAWLPDGGFELTAGAVRYDTEKLNDLRSMSIAMYMKIYVHTDWPGDRIDWGFPQGYLGSIFSRANGKIITQLHYEAPSFAFNLNHGDEVNGSVSGADCIWPLTSTIPPDYTPDDGGFPDGFSVHSWYSFRVHQLPWPTRWQQVFITYDMDAPQFSRWRLWVNGVEKITESMFKDNNPPNPIPPALTHLILGSTIFLEGGLPPLNPTQQAFQALYIWQGVRTEMIDLLIQDPYIIFGTVDPFPPDPDVPGPDPGPDPSTPSVDEGPYHITNRQVLYTTLEAWNLMTKYGLTDQQVDSCQQVEDLFTLLGKLFNHSDLYRVRYRTEEMLRRGEQAGVLTDQLIQDAETVADVHEALIALRGSDDDRDIYSSQYQGV